MENKVRIYTDEQIEVMIKGLENLFIRIALKKDLPAVKKHIVSLIESCNRAISAMQGANEAAAAFIAIKNSVINYQSLIVIVEGRGGLN